MIEIKPCPFCGREISEVDITSIDLVEGGNGMMFIRCCVTMEDAYILDSHCAKNSAHIKEKVKLRLIKRWNKWV